MIGEESFIVSKPMICSTFRFIGSFIFFFVLYLLQLFGLISTVPQLPEREVSSEPLVVPKAKTDYVSVKEKKTKQPVDDKAVTSGATLSELVYEDSDDFVDEASAGSVESSTGEKLGSVEPSDVEIEGSVEPSSSENEGSDEPSVGGKNASVESPAGEKKDSVESSAEERKDSVKSSAGEKQGSVVLSVGEKKASIVPSSGERQGSIEASAGEKKSSLEPTADEKEGSTEPSIGEKEGSIAPSAGEREGSINLPVGEATDSSGSKAYVEGVVCNESELAENSMKVCNLGEDNRVLVIKQNGEINAVGTQCTHYGAPLVAGALGEGRVRCPWHGACFSVKTGDIEDFPGLDSLPCYKVTVGPTGDIHVRAKKNDLEANRRLKDMGCRDISNKSTFVIVGGGGAGECCAETLRQEGFSGRLLMVTNEATPPYDRPKLSKQMDATPDKVQLRPGSFYKEHDIELMLNSRAISICTLSKKLTLENGTHVGFDKIFLCTGSDARHVDLPGSDLGNIFTLRNVADIAQIYKTLTPESEVVIYGTSFIGMEAAAYCVGRVKSVTVVGRSRVPFKASLGEAIGNRLADLFTQKGVKLELGVTISAFSGETQVKECTLSDGRSIPATTVILGLGTVPATNFIVHSQIQLNENGTVPVNEYLETNSPGVFAGGDIAFAPVMANNDQPASIGHWQLAHYHGRIAALNMLGKTTPLETVPFFWTSLFGMSYRYSGYAKKYDDVLIGGSLDDLKFAAYYCDGEDVVAVCTAGTDPIASSFAEKLSQKRKLSKSFINSDLLGWHKNIE